MARKVWGIIAVFVIIAGIAWIVFKSYTSGNTVAWKAIPDNAAVIIEINNPKNLIGTLSSGSEIWESLSANSIFLGYKNGFEFIDSLLNITTVDQDLRNNFPAILSYHVNKESKVNILGLINTNDKITIDRLMDLLENRFIVYPLKDVKNAYKLLREESGKELLIGFKSGLIVLTYDKFLFNESIKNISSSGTHFSEQPDFISLRETSGSNVDAHIYLNYEYLGPLLKAYSNVQFTSALTWLEGFAKWTEVDVMIKQNEVLMTGFTTVDSSGNNFLDRISKRDPVQHKVFNIIPFNTNLLLSYGIPKDYQPSTKSELIIKKLKVDPADFFNQINGEVALVSNSSRSSADNHWFIARANNPDKMDQVLRKMAGNSGGKSAGSGKYLYREIKYDKLIPDLFGSSCSIIKNSWYFFIEDFVIFGNSPQSLTNFSRYYETGKTLDLNEGFDAISDNIAKKSNLLLLIKPHDFLHKPDTYLNSETARNIENYATTVNNIQGLAIQFTDSDPFIYSSFYLLNNPDYKEDNLAVWKTELDGNIARKPFLVKDHKTGMFNIVAFDDDANIYLISTDGKILWKKRIDALPESPIFQVDFYKNNKIQYLFNTRDFIYLVDKNGENVANYPRKLNPSATNGLNLFDYDNKKDYRLVVAQADKRIYNYTIKGKQVNGWSKPKTSNIVSDPITRLVAGKKDYFIINDLDNNISIVNRRGSRRIKLTANPHKARNSSFYINKTNSKGIIITTNNEGKLTYIDKNGNLKYTDFGNFSPIHFFLYEDFNSDGAKDFIYVDGSELKVFDRFKNVLFSFTFESTISIKPEFFSLGSKQKVLGVVADQEKAVYLFDKKGNTIISRGLISETPFTVGSLENNSEINLLTAAGNILYNYRIK